MTNKWQRWKNIMKAYPFEEKRLAKWKPPYIIQPKYDGFRCRAVPVETGSGFEYLLLSSEEHIFYSVPHINEELARLKLRSELDGELYCHNMGFDKISSIVSRTVNLHQDHKAIQFHIFDVINEKPQVERLLFIEQLKGLSPWIQVSPFWLCYSLDEVMKTYDNILRSGYEGIIARHQLTPYERKRSTMMMKFKPKAEDTYPIVGYKEEHDIYGTPKDRLGALVCDSGNGHTFDVGTGFSDDTRYELWCKRDLLVGKQATVQYQHLTEGKQKPRFPVFVSIIN